MNRDLLDKQELYFNKFKSEYKDIYGKKGVKFCNDMQNNKKNTPKKTNKVKFSDNIQYSINQFVISDSLLL